MRVLILGATGMLGNTVFRVFSKDNRYEVWGTIRSEGARRYFSNFSQARLIARIDALDQDALINVVSSVRPAVVINCVGVIKQLVDAKNPLTVLPLNAILPHRLEKLCALAGARLIHVSTDCVFSGRKGGYIESDISDAEDLYGKSKFIGEPHDLPHTITLRTSIIGHALKSNNALIDWFLSQESEIKGYAKAVFSGLPTIVLAQIMKDIILPHPDLHGLYHISAKPIDKLSLLKLVANVYGKKISILRDEKIVIDRTLNSERFSKATGYVAPEWPDLIKLMHESR